MTHHALVHCCRAPLQILLIAVVAVRFTVSHMIAGQKVALFWFAHSLPPATIIASHDVIAPEWALLH